MLPSSFLLSESDEDNTTYLATRPWPIKTYGRPGTRRLGHSERRPCMFLTKHREFMQCRHFAYMKTIAALAGSSCTAAMHRVVVQLAIYFVALCDVEQGQTTATGRWKSVLKGDLDWEQNSPSMGGIRIPNPTRCNVSTKGESFASQNSNTVRRLPRRYVDLLAGNSIMDGTFPRDQLYLPERKFDYQSLRN